MVTRTYCKAGQNLSHHGWFCVYMLECWLVCRGLVVESKRQPEISTLTSLINWAKLNLSNKKALKKRQDNSGEHSMHNLTNVCG